MQRRSSICHVVLFIGRLLKEFFVFVHPIIKRRVGRVRQTSQRNATNGGVLTKWVVGRKPAKRFSRGVRVIWLLIHCGSKNVNDPSRSGGNVLEWYVAYSKRWKQTRGLTPIYRGILSLPRRGLSTNTRKRCIDE